MGLELIMTGYSEHRGVFCVLVELTLYERCDRGIANVNDNLPMSLLMQGKRARHWQGLNVNA